MGSGRDPIDAKHRNKLEIYEDVYSVYEGIVWDEMPYESAPYDFGSKWLL